MGRISPFSWGGGKEMGGTDSNKRDLPVSRAIPKWAGVASSSEGQLSQCESPRGSQTNLPDYTLC